MEDPVLVKQLAATASPQAEPASLRALLAWFSRLRD
jgi:hypothetical protein